MIDYIKLLLPILIPSWRFFETVAPSPRIEYCVLNEKEEEGGAERWQDFRPKPQKLSVLTFLQRLFWNPHQNETLFMMSCAERIITQPETKEHSIRMILACIRKDILSLNEQGAEVSHVKLRLVFVEREALAEPLNRKILFVSDSYSISGGGI